MFTCPVLILLYAWLTLTFQCEYSDFCSLLSIGHTALGIVFLSSSDQFYLDIWLYKLCNFIILSMPNKLSWDLHIGRCQQIIRSVIALKLYSDVNNFRIHFIENLITTPLGHTSFDTMLMHGLFNLQLTPYWRMVCFS